MIDMKLILKQPSHMGVLRDLSLSGGPTTSMSVVHGSTIGPAVAVWGRHTWGPDPLAPTPEELEMAQAYEENKEFDRRAALSPIERELEDLQKRINEKQAEIDNRTAKWLEE